MYKYSCYFTYISLNKKKINNKQITIIKYKNGFNHFQSKYIKHFITFKNIKYLNFFNFIDDNRYALIQWKDENTYSAISMNDVEVLQDGEHEYSLGDKFYKCLCLSCLFIENEKIFSFFNAYRKSTPLTLGV